MLKLLARGSSGLTRVVVIDDADSLPPPLTRVPAGDGSRERREEDEICEPS